MLTRSKKRKEPSSSTTTISTSSNAPDKKQQRRGGEAAQKKALADLQLAIEQNDLASLQQGLLELHPASFTSSASSCTSTTTDLGAVLLPDTAKNDPDPVLVYACRLGRKEVVNWLLAQQGVSVNQTKGDGATPVLIAAQNGHLTVVQALLEAGASVNQANSNGFTPLSVAAQEGHLKVVQALLEAGADTRLADIYGWTALDLSVHGRFSSTDPAVAQCLVRHLVRLGDNSFKLWCDPDGKTLLDWCLARGWVDMVEFLIQKDAKFSAGTLSAISEASGPERLARNFLIRQVQTRQYTKVQRALKDLGGVLPPLLGSICGEYSHVTTWDEAQQFLSRSNSQFEISEPPG